MSFPLDPPILSSLLCKVLACVCFFRGLRFVNSCVHATLVILLEAFRHTRECMGDLGASHAAAHQLCVPGRISIVHKKCIQYLWFAGGQEERAHDSVGHCEASELRFGGVHLRSENIMRQFSCRSAFIFSKDTL